MNWRFWPITARLRGLSRRLWICLTGRSTFLFAFGCKTTAGSPDGNAQATSALCRMKKLLAWNRPFNPHTETSQPKPAVDFFICKHARFCFNKFFKGKNFGSGNSFQKNHSHFSHFSGSFNSRAPLSYSEITNRVT